MTLVEQLHAERKARLIRLGAAPSPVRALAPKDPDEVTPAEQIKTLTAENKALSAENQLLSKRLQELEWMLEGLRTKLADQDNSFIRLNDDGTPQVLLNDILIATSQRFAIAKSAIVGPGRTGPTILPRQVFSFLAKEQGTSSLSQIGKVLGGRDHTTILHGANRISSMLEHDHLLRSQVDAIRALAQSRAFQRLQNYQAGMREGEK